MFPQEINIDGFVRCIFGISAYTGERMVSNMRLSLKVGNVTKKTKSFVSLSDMIETFKRYRLDFRKILVDAGCNIFQSFEMQFEKIGFDHVSKIADDTIDKIIEYYTQKEHKKKLDCIGIAEALISDKYSQEVPDKIVKYGKKNYSLRDLYENIEIIREEKSSFVYYRRNNEDKSGQYGYRRFLIGERKDTTYIGIEAKNKGSENYLYTLDSQDFKKIVKEVFNIINQEIQVPSTKIIQNCIVKIKSHIELEVSFLSNYILPYRQDRKKSFNVHMKSFKETAKLRESEKATNSKNRLDRAKKNSKIISLMEENLKKTSNSLYCQKVKKTFVSHTEAICQDYVNSSDLQCTSTARPRNLWSRIKVPSEKGLVSLFRKINLKDVCAPVGEFTGRDEQIDEIYEKLQEGAVAIVGPSGIGKTQLARKFVEENKGVYLHAYEVNTQDILSIESSFASLVRDRLSMCMERERNKEKKKCLFLFQGVKKEDLKRILKIRGQRGGFDCLFTSSDQGYQDIAEVSLDSLGEKEAVQLVKRILEIVDGSQDEQIKALVGKLKGFPLAIKLAATCIKNKGSSPLGEAFGICEYLIQYERFDQKFLQNTKQNEYARILQITSLISIEAIEEMYSGEEVFKILNAMAYFGCSEINPSVFLAWIRDEDELYSVFELLEQYSMIYSEEEDKYKVYIMHELIKKAIRSQLNIDEEKQILSCVIGLVSETEGGFLEVSHLLSLFEHSQKYDYLIGENKNFPCLVLSSLNKLCEYQKVINLASKSYELLTVDDGYSRLIKYEFACAQASLGWYNRALTIFLDLKKLEKTNGAFSPISLDKKILSTYLKQKNYKEALSYVKRNDFIVTRLFDEEALESIEEYLNVATIVAKIFVMQKKYTDAFTILYYVRQLRDEIFLERNDFKSHGDPYIYPSEAYEFYNLDEKYAYALACFFISQDRKKVTINERMLPCEEDLSPKLSIQALLEQLQDVLKNQEDSQYLQPAPYSIEENIDEGLRKTLSNRTLQYFKKVLKLQKDYEFSESAAIVLSVKFYIALLHSDLGERKRALQELQQLQEIQEEIIGISHPDTLETVDAIQKLFTRGEDRLIYLKNEIEKRESLLQFKRSDLNAQGVSILKEMYAKESSNYYPSVNTSSSEDLLSQDKRPLDIGNTQAKRRKIDNKQVSSYFNDVNIDLSYQQDAIVNLSCI
ncbi:hypothetical protein EJB00_03890 [Wolbachia endosymbiont of Drosophila mauritiana]|uniref:NB-ARC domain-containing protein n=1 Tax=unclassified Wolbachia TaxID=2640676 RepID=UPI00107E9385|nr:MULTISPECIES: NB-ARC domain-containing protein [unclassified Wolbachia]QCB62726.1 hypothetical protein EJA99_03900 [Wolbachia endosymbiont of Drosophila mauritiana]QCB63773.1 hypothetical protein EJB00_03890 [Wolbachia endosymbiont of Drosophila mauritiana]QWE33961.1 Uncharacterized protein WwMa_10990 [Wolbachia endosymbiont of Drosophila simulans]TGB05800.1 hypothetical protein E5C28_05795 [Wolbachia endosymbiont of Drosophila mauritiana]